MRRLYAGRYRLGTLGLALVLAQCGTAVCEGRPTRVARFGYSVTIPAGWALAHLDALSTAGREYQFTLASRKRHGVRGPSRRVELNCDFVVMTRWRAEEYGDLRGRRFVSRWGVRGWLQRWGFQGQDGQSWAEWRLLVLGPGDVRRVRDRDTLVLFRLLTHESNRRVVRGTVAQILASVKPSRSVGTVSGGTASPRRTKGDRTHHPPMRPARPRATQPAS